jgi:ectoine hydroxylase-related dioxygenase (phytanoyl-CoA dioxygenase family)
MLTLPGQFEFLSDAWVEEARDFLERDATAMSATISAADRWGGCAFSLSERYTDAPPHLGFDRNVATWAVRYDGQGVHISRGFDVNADVLVEGDYQAGVSAAQGVGWGAPDEKAAMLREIAHMYGEKSLRVRGGPKDEAAGEMLAVVHDHMARQTVDNPDLAHRAARQGLTDKLRDMHEQGFVVIERAISPQFADELREATLRTLMINRARLPHKAFMMDMMLYEGRPYELIAQNPLLLTLIDASLGRGAVMGGLTAVRHVTGPTKIPMHCDYQHVPEPFPEFALTGVGVWALEDWEAGSGGTEIVPGSHRMRRGLRPGENYQAVPTVMPKGSVVFFTEGVWHGQGDRTEPGDRVTLHQHMNRGFVRTVQPMIAEPNLLHRNSPRIGEMLGLDDQFGKMTADGRDFTRIDYINQLNAFSEAKRKKVLEHAS